MCGRPVRFVLVCTLLAVWVLLRQMGLSGLAVCLLCLWVWVSSCLVVLWVRRFIFL